MINPLKQEDVDRLKETTKVAPITLERKPFNSTDFLGDYLTKGFYSFSAKHLMAPIEIQRFEVVTVKHEDNCFHAEGHEFHNDYMRLSIEQLGRDLRRWLHEVPVELTFDFFAESVNDHVQHWHSDAQYAMPEQNATINCFFDNTSETLGGRFDMAPYSADIIGTKKLPGYFTSIYPQAYDVIIFNQNRNFLHKAVPSVAKRRMVSFAATFADINPLLPNWQP
ncbi:hypothetical protein AVU38_gp079 [Ralstonia phage RSL2]|uniref:hypothetical protein n=1 Tax=Ralstonia phage RSL2 TaxID=1585840 RepID=UPI00054A83F6|nr:hypothetical protein AVU38_gp079 [Ralstonia phage RSL2]